jgi:hypothetical protein
VAHDQENTAEYGVEEHERAANGLFRHGWVHLDEASEKNTGQA